MFYYYKQLGYRNTFCFTDFYRDLLFFFLEIPLGKYFLKAPGSKCFDNELIDNIEDCKSAISELQLTFTFIGSGALAGSPTGCIRIKASEIAYWNPASMGTTHYGYEPICQIGE